MEHASDGLGGSSAARTLKCPGWRRLLADLPEAYKNQTSVFAQEGQEQHENIELVVKGEAKPSTEKVDKAHEAFLALLEDEDASIDDVMTEERVELEGIDGAFGTCDIIVDGPRLVVLDWKFGDGVIVDAEGNDQLQYYANGALDTIFDPDAFLPEDEVLLAIVQPARDLDDIVSSWSTTVGALRAWKQEYEAALQQDYLALGPWCRFCPCQVICPKMRGAVEDVSALPYDTLSPEALGEALDLSRLAEAAIRDMREFAHHEMTAGIEVPGWKLVAKRATRAWTEVKDVVAFFKRRRIKIDQYYPRQLISPAAADKLGVEVPDELVDKKSSGTTIVPETDKRTAIQPGLEQAAAALAAINTK